MARGLSELQKTMLQMAYKNRQSEWEPRPVVYRLEVFDRPEDKDLRGLVPEAFTRFPDGYWHRYGLAFCLIVNSFDCRSPEECKAKEDLKTSLTDRGLHPHEAWEQTDYLCDLFTNEILCAVYDFKERGPLANAHPTGFPNARIARDWHGSYTELPHRNSARVAVSRAFDRLSHRGLAERRGAAINLTEQGMETAKGLLVNSVYIINTINQ